MERLYYGDKEIKKIMYGGEEVWPEPRTFMLDALAGIDKGFYDEQEKIDAVNNAQFFHSVLSVPSGRLMCEKYLQEYAPIIQSTLASATTLFSSADVHVLNSSAADDNLSGNVIAIPIAIRDDGDTYMDLYSMNDASLIFRLGRFNATRAVTDAEKRVLVGGYDAVWNGSSVGYLTCKVFTKI